ncbi:hypothetical protein C8E83_1931 [Frondihabitans australicus]|uniref:Uncharacterized protein n=1 Tax=Frondihabitans australicus TaxID=386892 RepID=A0A495IHL8_9MICO|nr:hypothetical protein C8E83_1931 [Frondihabitans australicus]
MSDPKPASNPAPDVDPDTGTEPDGTPVENPSGHGELRPAA